MRHLKELTSFDVDWLANLYSFSSFQEKNIVGSGGISSLVFNSWKGTLRSVEVTYESKEKKWATDSLFGFEVEGEADSRKSADLFRAFLVAPKESKLETLTSETKKGKRLDVAVSYKVVSEGNGVENESP